MSNKKAKTYKHMSHIYGSKQEYCQGEKEMDYNPTTRRCLKKCKTGKTRDNRTYKCISIKQRGTTKERCHARNMDYNSKTNRCLKKCKSGKTRSEKTNRCVSQPVDGTVALSIPIQPVKQAKNTEIENTFIFISNIEKLGKPFHETGMEYRAYGILFTLSTLYLLEKYKTNCFVLQQMRSSKKQPMNCGASYMFKLGLEDDPYKFDKLKELNKPLNKFITQVFNCIEKMKPDEDVIFIPIQFKININANHANLLVYRKTLNVLEHFEPNGKFYKYNNGIFFIEDIVDLMNAHNRTLNYKYYSTELKYVKPTFGCPFGFAGFQRIEGAFPKIKPGIVENGYCVMWSIFMAEMVLMNPTLRNHEIIDKIYKWMEQDNNKNPVYLSNIIRGYFHFVHKYINEHLKIKYNVNIDSSKEIPYIYLDRIYKEINKNDFVKYNGMEVQDYFDKKDSASLKLSFS